MTIILNEKIRAFRKERSMTQEQLAEALGVTVGAVSKWESGQSIPELALIVELASLFETSVDVLLGYQWHSGTVSETVERIRTLRNEKRFDDAATEVEKALLKYPNCFEIAHSAAVLYSMAGIEKADKKSFTRALGLFDRALELIAQNTDPKINQWTIRNHIADVYACLGQTDRAVEELIRNNAGNLNDGNIGFILATAQKKTDEALPYLTDALMTSVMEVYREIIGLSNCYSQKGDNKKAIDALLWLRGIISSLGDTDSPTAADMLEAQILCGCMLVAAADNDEDGARRYLKSAVASAAKFDSAPEYTFGGMKFFSSETRGALFSDFGSTAMAGVRKQIDSDESVAPMLNRLWQEVVG